MNVKLILRLFLSSIGGIIVTGITGLYSYPTDGIVGVEKWGFPFYWLSKIIYHGADKIINWSNFIINTLIWSSLVFLIIYISEYLVNRFKNRKSNKKI